jgi:hypothetical protein
VRAGRGRGGRGGIALVLSGVACLLAGCQAVTYGRTDVLTPIPSVRPITTSGVVQSYDAGTLLLTFADGRAVRIGEGTRVGRAVGGSLRRGEMVIVDAATPVGVYWPSGYPQLR